MICPKCASEDIVKNGSIHNKKQNSHVKMWWAVCREASSP